MPMHGHPVRSARSMILVTFSANTSPSEPPKTDASWLKMNTCRPSIVPHPVMTPSPRMRRSLHAEVGGPVEREHVELGERAGVEQTVDALARGELALGVLGALRRAAPMHGVVAPLAQHVDLLVRATTRPAGRRPIGIDGHGCRVGIHGIARADGRNALAHLSGHAVRLPGRRIGFDVTRSPRGWYTPKISRSTPHTSPTVACAVERGAHAAGADSPFPRHRRRRASNEVCTAAAERAARTLREPLDLRRLEVGADPQDLAPSAAMSR